MLRIRARGKVGSIGVVVGIEMVVDKMMDVVDVVDDEEPEPENGVEIAVESWVEGTAVEIEIGIALTLC